MTSRSFSTACVKILTQEGFDVTTTLNGREGIESAISNHFDIVLTDVRMPNISGKIVLREIKRAKPRPCR